MAPKSSSYDASWPLNRETPLLARSWALEALRKHGQEARPCGCNPLCCCAAMFRGMFVPDDQLKKTNSFMRQKRKTCKRAGWQNVQVVCEPDHVCLDAIWVEPQGIQDEMTNAVGDKERTTVTGCWCVLLFHANGGVAHDMEDFASFYQEIGCASLMITIRGYPGSGGSCKVDGEGGLYRDAAAAVRFAEARGYSKDKMIAHGFSLGGALAAAAAKHHDLTACTLDHTFTDPKEMALEMMRDDFPPSLVAGAIGDAWPKDLPVDVGGGLTIKTDGLCTLKKMANYQGQLFVIYGTQDKMMPTHFAESLLIARYGDTEWRKSNDKVPVYAPIKRGGHMQSMFFNDPDAKKRYRAYLDKLMAGCP